MKLLFTADIHIKLNQKNVPVEWSKNRYSLLISELVSHQKNCDLFVIGGDIFDKIPTMDELEIYFNIVSSCIVPTIIYSGNHEALKKNTTFFTNLKQVTEKINSKVQIIDDFHSIDNIDIIPYNKLKEYNPADIDFHGDILLTHVRGDIPPHVKAEVPLELFDRWKVVLAGDLHSYENSQRNILYPGSPITTSFHRSIVSTGVIILDTDTCEHSWVALDLPQLIRKTINAGDLMESTQFHHTIYEIEGDMSELGDLEDNDLIDKKIVKREVDTALILSSEMSIVEETKEYLTYILQLEDSKVEDLVQHLNNNIEKLEE